MKRRIIVVDDNSDVTSSIRNRLNSLDAGYEVISVDNGMKCFNLLIQVVFLISYF